MKLLSSCSWLLAQILRLALCLFFAYVATGDTTNGMASKNWPRTNCTLTTAEVRQVKSKNGTEDQASIQYRYTVNGHTYTADRVQFGGLAYRDQRNVVETLKNGKELIVYYNPNQPEISCLETGFNLKIILLEYAGSVLMLGLSIADLLKKRKSKDVRPGWKMPEENKRLRSMPGLKQQKGSSSMDRVEDVSKKATAKTLIFMLTIMAIVFAVAHFTDNVHFAGIPSNVLGILVLLFGGMLVITLISSLPPLVAILMRLRKLELAELVANINAAIYSPFPASYETVLARGLQAEVAQEQLQYMKALSLSQQALNAMAERKALVARALEHEEQLPKIARQLDQKHHAALESVCTESLGCILFDMGLYDEAMVHAQDALRMAEDLIKDPSTANASTKTALANALALKGRIENILGSLDAAKADLERAIAVRKEFKQVYPERIAILMANLASTYTMQSEYRKAENLIDDGLKIVDGSEKPAMELAKATLLFYRAETKMRSGQYSIAEKSLRECLALREKWLLPNHLEIAEAQLAFANLNDHLGKSRDAAQQRQRAAAILKACFGDNHPLMPTTDTIKTRSKSLSSI